MLGNLFKSKTRDVMRNELIILMHPEVVNTAGIMDDVREKEENRTYLGHDLEDQLLPNVPCAQGPARQPLPGPSRPRRPPPRPPTSQDDKLHPAQKRTTVQTKRYPCPHADVRAGIQ